MFKRFIIILVLLANAFPIAVAIDWNLDMLGFSPNSKYFVLAESMTERSTGIARAKINIMNVAINGCVQNGCLTASGSEKNLKTEDKVLNELYRKTQYLRQRLGLTQKRLGGYQAEGPFFRGDNCNGHAYYLYDNLTFSVRLQQQGRTGVYPPYTKAAMQLNVTLEEYDVTVVLDSLDNYREFIDRYQLGYLFVSPNKTNVAILVYAYHRGVDGEDIRTMVKTTTFFLPLNSS
jgi:predicted secreted protein